jgi:hypothetical protein
MKGFCLSVRVLPCQNRAARKAKIYHLKQWLGLRLAGLKPLPGKPCPAKSSWLKASKYETATVRDSMGASSAKAARVNLPREFYAVIGIAALAAGLLLARAFAMKEPPGEPAPPPSREDELKAARADALRQIEILQSPMRSRDTTGWGHDQIARLKAVVAGIDAELKS